MSAELEPVRRQASVVGLTMCLVAAASAATVGVTTESASASQRVAVSRLEANLTGSGDPDGSGKAAFRLSKSQHRVCAMVTWHKIGTPNAAHIHRASDGGVVIDLTGSVTGGARCTTKASRALVGKILAHPGQYYFNVHNAKYPAGAIQGTLHR